MAAGGRRESGKRECGMRGREELQRGEEKRLREGCWMLWRAREVKERREREGKRGRDGCTNGEYEERLIEGGGGKEVARQ